MKPSDLAAGRGGGVRHGVRDHGVSAEELRGRSALGPRRPADALGSSSATCTSSWQCAQEGGLGVASTVCLAELELIRCSREVTAAPRLSHVADRD